MAEPLARAAKAGPERATIPGVPGGGAKGCRFVQSCINLHRETKEKVRKWRI